MELLSDFFLGWEVILNNKTSLYILKKKKKVFKNLRQQH